MKIIATFEIQTYVSGRLMLHKARHFSFCMENNATILDATIQRNDAKFIANKLGDEMVMMNMDNGDFVSMNRVGADIWTICEHPMTVKELIQKLLSLYNISEQQCRDETVRFLQTTMDQGIFTIRH